MASEDCLDSTYGRDERTIVLPRGPRAAARVSPRAGIARLILVVLATFGLAGFALHRGVHHDDLRAAPAVEAMTAPIASPPPSASVATASPPSLAPATSASPTHKMRKRRAREDGAGSALERLQRAQLERANAR